MPMYEYRCQSCGTRFEAWQKMTDDPLTTCQTCGGPVRRILYPAGIVFKGSGFYSTDHRSSGHHESAPSPAGSESKSEGAKAPAESTSTTSSTTSSKSE